MIKEYLDPLKGNKFRHIDLKKAELESTIKYMPLSFDRQTIECKKDIARCDNFN